VHACVTRITVLNEYLRDTLGLFFPIDPWRRSPALGGDGGRPVPQAPSAYATARCANEECAGADRGASPTAKVIHTFALRGPESRPRGYDLTGCFVGLPRGPWELLITQVTLKLLGGMSPEGDLGPRVCPSSRRCAAAVDTVILTIQSGIPVARIELLDEPQMEAINKYSKLDYKVAQPFSSKFHGTNNGVSWIGEGSAGQGHCRGPMVAGDFRWASAQEERNNCGRRGSDAYLRRAGRCVAARRVGDAMSCVPDFGGSPDCIGETKAIWPSRRSRRALAGHVGDGNLFISSS